jgi:hypothetical protein
MNDSHAKIEEIITALENLGGKTETIRSLRQAFADGTLTAE